MDKIGSYQIEATLHRGPQPLYRARAADGRIVALKTIPVADLTPEMRERFTREAQTCRTLEHPNLVRVFDTGEADGMLYQAMELLEGSDLGKVMADGRHFTWDGKLSVMEQVCEGLQFAHDHKLVHRDIKPANLFLENSGRVRVLDFGMVRVAESQLTKVGASVGTLNYMSPEQIRGERCTAASDVFSAGIVFYQLATGKHPFSTRERNLGQVVSAIVFETPPPLTQLCPDAPEGLEFILNKALEKDPVKRLQNAGDLKQALSLCRITMKLGVPAAPSPVTDVNEKTRLIARVEAGGAPVDDQKTRVMKRAAPAAMPVAAPPSPPPARVVAAAPPKSVPPGQMAASQFRYCPACTSPNPPGAAVCAKCGTPFSGSMAAAERPRQWGLYVAIGAAVLLAIALVVVLIVKR